MVTLNAVFPYHSFEGPVRDSAINAAADAEKLPVDLRRRSGTGRALFELRQETCPVKAEERVNTLRQRTQQALERQAREVRQERNRKVAAAVLAATRAVESLDPSLVEDYGLKPYVNTMVGATSLTMRESYARIVTDKVRDIRSAEAQKERDAHLRRQFRKLGNDLRSWILALSPEIRGQYDLESRLAEITEMEDLELQAVEAEKLRKDVSTIRHEANTRRPRKERPSKIAA